MNIMGNEETGKKEEILTNNPKTWEDEEDIHPISQENPCVRCSKPIELSTYGIEDEEFNFHCDSLVCVDCYLRLYFPLFQPKYELMRVKQIKCNSKYNLTLRLNKNDFYDDDCIIALFLTKYNLINTYYKHSNRRNNHNQNSIILNSTFNDAPPDIEGGNFIRIHSKNISKTQNKLSFECLNFRVNKEYKVVDVVMMNDTQKNEASQIQQKLQMQFPVYLLVIHAKQIQISSYLTASYKRKFWSTLRHENQFGILQQQQQFYLKTYIESNSQPHQANPTIESISSPSNLSPQLYLRTRNFHEKYPYLYSNEYASKMHEDAVMQYPVVSYHHQHPFDIRDYCDKYSFEDIQWLCPICNKHRLFLSELQPDFYLYLIIQTQFLNNTKITTGLHAAYLQQKIFVPDPQLVEKLKAKIIRSNISKQQELQKLKEIEDAKELEEVNRKRQLLEQQQKEQEQKKREQELLLLQQQQLLQASTSSPLHSQDETNEQTKDNTEQSKEKISQQGESIDIEPPKSIILEERANNKGQEELKQQQESKYGFGSDQYEKELFNQDIDNQHEIETQKQQQQQISENSIDNRNCEIKMPKKTSERLLLPNGEVKKIYLSQEMKSEFQQMNKLSQLLASEDYSEQPKQQTLQVGAVGQEEEGEGKKEQEEQITAEKRTFTKIASRKKNSDHKNINSICNNNSKSKQIDEIDVPLETNNSSNQQFEQIISLNDDKQIDEQQQQQQLLQQQQWLLHQQQQLQQEQQLQYQQQQQQQQQQQHYQQYQQQKQQQPLNQSKEVQKSKEEMSKYSNYCQDEKKQIEQEIIRQEQAKEIVKEGWPINIHDQTVAMCSDLSKNSKIIDQESEQLQQQYDVCLQLMETSFLRNPFEVTLFMSTYSGYLQQESDNILDLIKGVDISKIQNTLECLFNIDVLRQFNPIFNYFGCQLIQKQQFFSLFKIISYNNSTRIFYSLIFTLYQKYTQLKNQHHLFYSFIDSISQSMNYIKQAKSSNLNSFTGINTNTNSNISSNNSRNNNCQQQQQQQWGYLDKVVECILGLAIFVNFNLQGNQNDKVYQTFQRLLQEFIKYNNKISNLSITSLIKVLNFRFDQEIASITAELLKQAILEREEKEKQIQATFEHGSDNDGDTI